MTTESCQRNEDLGCCFRAISQPGLRVIWEITSQCNLGCRHCFGTPATQRDLTYGEATTIIHSMARNGVRKIALTGGEPFLRPDLIDIVKFVRRQGILPKVLTNGMFLSEETIERLRDVGEVEVSVSLDGGTDLTHDGIRGKRGAFRATTEGLSRLQRMGLRRVHATCVVSRLNYGEVEGIVELANVFGLRSVNFSNLLTVNILALPRLNAYRAEYSLSPEEQLSMKQAVERARLRFPEIAVRTLGFADILSVHECDAGNGVLFIDVDGCLHPCSIARLHHRFSLREKSFGDILATPSFLAMRHKNQALCRAGTRDGGDAC